MKQQFRAWVAGVCLVLMASAGFGAPYATTGVGTSTIGTGGDYASLAAAVSAVTHSADTAPQTIVSRAIAANVATYTLSGASPFTVNQQITIAGTATQTVSTAVTNKVKATNVATITCSTAPNTIFVVNETVQVALSPADAAFDGAAVITAVTATTFSYTRNGANVATAAATGTASDKVFEDGTYVVTASAGSTVSYSKPAFAVASAAATGTITGQNGTRDASAWTFTILNDLTESANSDLRCTVNAAGSITFKPASGVRPTVTWPATIPANAGASGHLVIGCSINASPLAAMGYMDTANIIIDGNNGDAAGTRDMVFQNQQGDLEGAIGIIRVRGNCDGIQIQNMIINDPNSGTATAQAVTFTSDQSALTAQKCPDNWIVNNCQISMNTNAGASSAIIASNSGTITAAQAQTGWSITNNILTGGSRLVDLNQSGSGIVRGNTIHASNNGGNLGACIYLRGTNASTGNTFTIDKNYIDSIVYGNNGTGGDFGQFGIYLLPSATVAGTINITNNIIGGWSFGQQTSTDQTYAGIVIGSATTSAAGLVVNVEHNSINMNLNSFWPGTTAARLGAVVRRYTTTACTLSLKNNLIRYLQTGTNSAAIWSTLATNFTASGNDIFVSGTNVGNLGGTAYANLAAWQGAGFDATGGQSVDPTALASGSWVVSSAQSGNDLHFSNSTVTGLAATGVATALSTDIDGQARDTTGLALPGADVASPPAAATYTWNVNGTGDSRTAANWTPARTTPGWNDTLVIDGGVTAGPVTLTDVADQHLAGLKVINSVNATMTSKGGVTRLWIWNGDAAASADFSVGAGSALTLTGVGGIVLDMNACTGSVSGDLNMIATSNATPARITCKTANALVFASGSSCGFAPTVASTGAPFSSYIGEAAVNGVQFQSGSSYNAGAIKTGVRGGPATTNPFSFTAPNSAVQFDLGSDYVSWDGTPSVTGRTYGGNFIWRNSVGSAVGGASAWILNGSFSSASAGGGSATVTNKVLTTNVATLTIGATAIPFVVGQGVTVALSPADAAFDGNPVITAVSGSTISYARNNADVASVATGGTAITSNGAYTMTGAGALTVGGSFTVTAGCASISLAGSTGATHAIGGNVDIQDATLFTPPAGATVLSLNGSSAQNANFAGKTILSLSDSNAAGVNLTGNVTANTLNVTAGNLSTGVNTLTVGTAGTIAGTLTAASGGTLNVGTVALSGAGTVNIASGGTLRTANLGVAGAEFASLNGVTNKSINAGATVFLSGVAAQTLGSALLPSSIAGITVNNPTNVNMLQNVDVSTQLNLMAGTLSPNGFLLTGPDGAGGVIRTAGYVNGALKRFVDMTQSGSRFFPVGSGASYAPFTLNVNDGSDFTGSELTVSTSNSASPNALSANGLTRTWTLTPDVQPDGAFDAGFVFGYNDPADLGGSVLEANLKVAKDVGAGVFTVYPTTVDTVNNTLTVASGIDGFSVWTAGDATAVPVSVSAFSID